MSISVIISIRNRELDRLRLAIGSIKKNTYRGPVQVVVSDYGSTNSEEVHAVADDLGADYIFTDAAIWNKSEALNRGLSLATHDLLITLDLDMLVAPKTLEGVVRAADANPNSCIVLQSRDLPDTYTPASLLSLTEIPWDELEENSVVRARWGIGGLFAFPRTALGLTGGLDERMTGWGAEDLDFAKRCQTMGYRILWLEEQGAGIYHVWHPSTKLATETDPEKKKLVELNREIYYHDAEPARNNRRDRVTIEAPRVSVVISTRNRSSMIEESINSVLAQSMGDLEVIVVNDGSEDDTVDVVKQIDSDRVRLYSVAPSGIAAARNIGTAKARGAYIAVHDDDDLMTPRRLEYGLRAFRGGVGATYGSLINFQDETGEMKLNVTREEFGTKSLPVSSVAPGHSTWLVRKELMERIQYDEAQSSAVDNNLAIRMAVAGVEWRHTGEVHLMRRQHSLQTTVSDFSVQQGNAATAPDWFLRPLTRSARGELEKGAEGIGWPKVDLERKLKENEVWLPDTLVTRSILVKGDLSGLYAGRALGIQIRKHGWGDAAEIWSVLPQASWRDLAVIRERGLHFVPMTATKSTGGFSNKIAEVDVISAVAGVMASEQQNDDRAYVLTQANEDFSETEGCLVARLRLDESTDSYSLWSFDSATSALAFAKGSCDKKMSPLILNSKAIS